MMLLLCLHLTPLARAYRAGCRPNPELRWCNKCSLELSVTVSSNYVESSPTGLMVRSPGLWTAQLAATGKVEPVDGLPEYQINLVDHDMVWPSSGAPELSVGVAGLYCVQHWQHDASQFDRVVS